MALLDSGALKKISISCFINMLNERHLSFIT